MEPVHLLAGGARPSIAGALATSMRALLMATLMAASTIHVTPGPSSSFAIETERSELRSESFKDTYDRGIVIWFKCESMW